jgi:hypothetical protein
MYVYIYINRIIDLDSMILYQFDSSDKFKQNYWNISSCNKDMFFTY